MDSAESRKQPRTCSLCSALRHPGGDPSFRKAAKGLGLVALSAFFRKRCTAECIVTERVSVQAETTGRTNNCPPQERAASTGSNAPKGRFCRGLSGPCSSGRRGHVSFLSGWRRFCRCSPVCGRGEHVFFPGRHPLVLRFGFVLPLPRKRPRVWVLIRLAAESLPDRIHPDIPGHSVR
jgi:hypothetical protein